MSGPRARSAQDVRSIPARGLSRANPIQIEGVRLQNSAGNADSLGLEELGNEATQVDPALLEAEGIDIGNGYTKGVVRGSLDLPEGASRTDEVDLPSGVRSVRYQPLA